MQIGVDIGGTFTDIVALGGDGQLHLTKVPTTPKDLLRGVADAVRAVLALAGGSPGAVTRFIHGTTVATNAVLEQKGAVTGILMTQGFEDVLELGRQKRSRMYDLDMDPETPAFLAPRRRRVGIRERLDARGRVLTPLDEAQVRAEARRLRDEGVQALAVCYLFSFLDAAHERRTRGARPRGRARAGGVALVGGRPDLPRVRALLRDRLRRVPRAAGDALPGRAARHPAPCGRDRGAADHALARRHRLGGGGRRASPSRSSCRGRPAA